MLCGYDPEEGRFLTQDTYRGEADSFETWHLYAYCANNLIKYVDPSGHELVVSILLVGGTVITVGYLTWVSMSHTYYKGQRIISYNIFDPIKKAAKKFENEVKKKAKAIAKAKAAEQKSKSKPKGNSETEKNKQKSKKPKKKKQPSKKSGKEKANDRPEWSKHYEVREGENGKQFAKRIMDEQFVKGNWKPGPHSQYNQIKKWVDRRKW